jgi:opacity protein-like surface antigen
MKTFPALATVLSLAISGSAFAASYQTTRGDIIDPIRKRSGRPHYYAGPDLEPIAYLSRADLSRANLRDADLKGAYLSRANLSGADLSDADLFRANLFGANLSGAYLTFADLSDANLSGADLSGAYLSRADLSDADLSDANLSGANLYGAIGLERTLGRPDYNSTTDFTGTGFDPVAAGWHLVPEPTSLALLSLGGLLLTRRRRA